MVAIDISNLVKKYGDFTAVRNLNLKIDDGELFALLGVNGAGKTTTIKMLSGLTKPTSGDASLLGNSIIEQLPAVKEMINVSPQETAIAPNLSVVENLEFIARIYGLSKSQAKEEAKVFLQSLGLTDVASKKAKTLSGGMQRRLSIAMALISHPRILFLDEPTLGLDVLARRELWTIIEALKGKVTVVLTTHYMEEAEALSDRIGIMSNGKLVAIGTAEELKKLSGEENFEEAFIKLATERQEI